MMGIDIVSPTPSEPLHGIVSLVSTVREFVADTALSHTWSVSEREKNDPVPGLSSCLY
jgi:hypothetical protein